MPSRDQMLSRATAAVKARVAILEVPWSSQGWSRAWGRAPSDRAPPSAPARRRPCLACPDASHAANGEAPADTVRGETRERAAEPLGTHRGAPLRGSWRPRAAPAPTPTPPLAPLALGATCSDAELAPWKAGRKSPSTGAQWADDRSAVFLPLVFAVLERLGTVALFPRLSTVVVGQRQLR